MQYIYSLSIGIMVGILYAILHIKSPAPPIIALVGLLGMVIGETGSSMLAKRFEDAPQTVAVSQECPMSDNPDIPGMVDKTQIQEKNED